MPAPASSSRSGLFRPLYAGEMFSVYDVDLRPVHACTDELKQVPRHTLALPYRGMFTTHFGRQDAVVASANHALLLSACVEHDYSFQGSGRERTLALLWSDEALDRIAPDAIRADRFDAAALARAPLLPPGALLARERLRRLLDMQAAPGIAVDEHAVLLLSAALQAARRTPDRRSARAWRDAARRAARVERVKAAVAADSTRRWTLATLADVAGVSPLHLAREFRALVGTSVYEYVLQSRLGVALERVLETELDLTTIALDAGFASHSHFTSRFRERFGCTPSELRQLGGLADYLDGTDSTAAKSRAS